MVCVCLVKRRPYKYIYISTYTSKKKVKKFSRVLRRNFGDSAKDRDSRKAETCSRIQVQEILYLFF